MPLPLSKKASRPIHSMFPSLMRNAALHRTFRQCPDPGAHTLCPNSEEDKEQPPSRARQIKELENDHQRQITDLRREHARILSNIRNNHALEKQQLWVDNAIMTARLAPVISQEAGARGETQSSNAANAVLIRERDAVIRERNIITARYLVSQSQGDCARATAERLEADVKSLTRKNKTVKSERKRQSELCRRNIDALRAKIRALESQLESAAARNPTSDVGVQASQTTSDAGIQASLPSTPPPAAASTGAEAVVIEPTETSTAPRPSTIAEPENIPSSTSPDLAPETVAEEEADEIPRPSSPAQGHDGIREQDSPAGSRLRTQPQSPPPSPVSQSSTASDSTSSSSEDSSTVLAPVLDDGLNGLIEAFQGVSAHDVSASPRIPRTSDLVERSPAVTPHSPLLAEQHTSSPVSPAGSRGEILSPASPAAYQAPEVSPGSNADAEMEADPADQADEGMGNLEPASQEDEEMLEGLTDENLSQFLQTDFSTADMAETAASPAIADTQTLLSIDAEMVDAGRPSEQPERAAEQTTAADPVVAAPASFGQMTMEEIEQIGMPLPGSDGFDDLFTEADRREIFAPHAMSVDESPRMDVDAQIPMAPSTEVNETAGDSVTAVVPAEEAHPVNTEASDHQEPSGIEAPVNVQEQQPVALERTEVQDVDLQQSPSVAPVTPARPAAPAPRSQGWSSASHGIMSLVNRLSPAASSPSPGQSASPLASYRPPPIEVRQPPVQSPSQHGQPSPPLTSASVLDPMMVAAANDAAAQFRAAAEARAAFQPGTVPSLSEFTFSSQMGSQGQETVGGGSSAPSRLFQQPQTHLRLIDATNPRSRRRHAGASTMTRPQRRPATNSDNLAGSDQAGASVGGSGPAAVTQEQPGQSSSVNEQVAALEARMNQQAADNEASIPHHQALWRQMRASAAEERRRHDAQRRQADEIAAQRPIQASAQATAEARQRQAEALQRQVEEQAAASLLAMAADSRRMEPEAGREGEAAHQQQQEVSTGDSQGQNVEDLSPEQQERLATDNGWDDEADDMVRAALEEAAEEPTLERRLESELTRYLHGTGPSSG